MVNNHYETIGVTPDASPAEIKRAYRAKAVNHHPDKGGDIEEFKAVAYAYDVLKDPVRRQLYDTTGQDNRPPIEAEVSGILMALFNEALAGDDCEVTAFVRERIKAVGQKIPSQQQELNARKVKLQGKRGKIKAKGQNLVHMIIDAELHAIDGQLANLKHQIDVNKACLKALDKYKEEWEAPPPPQYTTFDMRRQYIAFTDVFGQPRD